MRANRGCSGLMRIDDQLLDGVMGGVNYSAENPHGIPKAPREDPVAARRRVDRPAFHRELQEYKASRQLDREFRER